MGKCFGKVIKAKRLEKNLDMKTLSKKLDISYVFMYRVEKGDVGFPIKRIKKLLKILGISPWVAKEAILKDYESLVHDELVEQGLIVA